VASLSFGHPSQNLSYLIEGRPEERLACSVGKHEDPSGLAPDSEIAPKAGIRIRHIGEVFQLILANEFLQRINRVSRANPNEFHLVLELSHQLCDRGSLLPAEGSPGCPQPQHDVLSGKVGTTDGAPSDPFSIEVQLLRER